MADPSTEDQPRGAWTHRFADGAGGVRLHYAEMRSAVGGDDAPLVILLHGFPEFWWSWRMQMPALAAAGYWVVAPDLRGYNLSESPPDVQDYRIDTLTEDVQRLIEHCDRVKAVIVGHDWGGVVAWRFAMDYPDSVDRLVVMNAPHPERMAEAFGARPNIRQIGRSWYMFLFQIPRAPERWLAVNDYERVGWIIRQNSARQDAFPPEVLHEYRRAAARQGLSGPLHYYRAAVRAGAGESRARIAGRFVGLGKALDSVLGPAPAAVSYAKISSPTLLLWGERDTALGRELTEGMDDLFSGPFELTYLPDCGHWVQQEGTEDVNRLMIEFLERYRDPLGGSSPS